MARHKKKIDLELVRRLAGLGLSQQQIADFVGCSQSLISRRCPSSYGLGVTKSRKVLRVLMRRQALGGNTPITLRLDQRLFGPMSRREAVGDAMVLDVLDQADKIAAALAAEEKKTI